MRIIKLQKVDNKKYHCPLFERKKFTLKTLNLSRFSKPCELQTVNRGNYAENSTFPSRLSPPLFPHLIYFLPLSKGVCLVGFHVSTMPPRFSQPMLHGPLAALSYTRGRKMIALKHAKYEDKVLRLFPKFIECM